MTVTQNAVKREGPQHRLVVLSCWFVSQQRSVGSLRLKVVSHCGETRALWQATPTQHAELQKWHVRETFWICNEVPALTTAFNNIKKRKRNWKHCSRCWQWNLLSTIFWFTRKGTWDEQGGNEQYSTKDMSAVSLCCPGQTVQWAMNPHGREAMRGIIRRRKKEGREKNPSMFMWSCVHVHSHYCGF